ncbi:tetratricopeptide repeat protein [Botrimarina hoheduenensis]|uniref:Lipoprotein NlpI n=1 Tax=Botrimarina hoheduenensis TaxID=2528000 RepID=A0A5C5WCD2_9BACT|nr:tetratricopeptide repeat protein [Botrimarina hoheduenensis]TWT48568.1 lipoprotein NlpI [Botrimarina hoheduenensis]
MRIILTIGLLASLTGPVTAAPASLLQSSSDNQNAAGTASSAPGRFGWLTKWFGGSDTAAVPGAVVAPQPSFASQGYPGGFSASTPVATTQLPYVPQSPSSSLSANDLQGMLSAAEAAEGRGQLDAARQILTQCAAAHPGSAQPHRRLGHLEDRAGRLADAERHYRQAIGCDPSSGAAMNDLGLCLARQGRFEASADAFRQAIMLRPDKALYRNNIATVLVQIGKTDEALANLQASYDPAIASYNLGQLLVKAERPAEAAEQFQRALAEDATLIPARQALAKLPTSFAPQLAESEPSYTELVTQQSESTYAGVPEFMRPQSEYEPATPPASSARVANAVAPATADFPRLLPPVIER